MNYRNYKEIGKLYETFKGAEWNPDEPGNRDKVIYANLPLAVKTALRYSGMGLSEDELLSAAMMGLCQAYDKYKPDNGIRKKLTDAVENGCGPEQFASIAGIKCLIESKEAMLVWIEANTKPAKFSSIIPFWVKAVVMKDLKAVGALESEPITEEIADSYADDDVFALLSDGIPAEWMKALEMRYGLGHEPHTLKSISEKLGITIAETKGRIRGAIAMIRQNKERLFGE